MGHPVFQYALPGRNNFYPGLKGHCGNNRGLLFPIVGIHLDREILYMNNPGYLKLNNFFLDKIKSLR
jgi:hypothetical protein